MRPSTLYLALGITSQAISQAPPSLFDALEASGASKFAAFIQSDPDLLALYTSGNVRTVFAPADSAVAARGYILSRDSGSAYINGSIQGNQDLLAAQQSDGALPAAPTAPSPQTTSSMSSSTSLTSSPTSLSSSAASSTSSSSSSSTSSKLSSSSTTSSFSLGSSRSASSTSSQGQPSPPATVQSLDNTVIGTFLQAPLLGNGQNQSVVSEPIGGTLSKRSQGPARRQSNSTAPNLDFSISSGLGSTTNILKGNIPFDRGFIHIVDSYFTIPQPLSTTAQQTGQTTFSSLASKSNLTASLDRTPSVTVFLPSNAAFAAANISAAVSNPSLLAGHVVPNFVGYLPRLTDGASLTTQSGGVLKVSVQGSSVLINGAKIVRPNLILENGVAHVIDKVLTPPSVPTSSAPAVDRANLARLLTVCLGGAVLAMAVF